MNNKDLGQINLKYRYFKERVFKVCSISAIGISILFLFFLLADITNKAIPAFTQTYIKLDISFSKELLGLEPKDSYTKQELFQVNYRALVNQSLKQLFPNVKKRKHKKALRGMISSGVQYKLRDEVLANPKLLGTSISSWYLADDAIDTFFKGLVGKNISEANRKVKDYQVGWIDKLKLENRITTFLNFNFFIKGDSREPEQAGILGALVGSFYAMLITLLLSLPIGILTAVYLEEFAPKNYWTDLIEVNINNLAAVPSIVFGLLGLAVYINIFGVPRSSALAGGLVLTLMTLPTIIIATRASLKSVPASIKNAALALGASKIQTTIHQTLPLAMPGILTGSIIGMAQALGETAPLLMIGMVAFIVDIPEGFLDPASALPVQIFIWSDSPERAFIALTSAAILVLLLFLFIMNLTAIILRKKFEIRW